MLAGLAVLGLSQDDDPHAIGLVGGTLDTSTDEALRLLFGYAATQRSAVRAVAHRLTSGNLEAVALQDTA